MKLRAGMTLSSTVDATTVVVVRAPAAEVTITCGGAEMVDAKSDAAKAKDGTADPAQQGGALLGKRYADEELGLELLCSKGGEGTLAVNGSALLLKDAKALPASD
ncbi:MAG: hypothetical protein ABR549_17210 [Mycobacteriales bacterium]